MKTAARALAIAAMVISGAAVILRAFGVAQTHSPMNAEGIFGAAAIVLMLLSSTSAQVNASGTTAGQSAEKPSRASFDLSMLAALAMLVAITYGRVAGSYFLSDDFVLLRHAQEYGHTVWRTFTHGGGDGFFRPLIYLSVALTAPWAGTNPWAWHIPALALHVANSWLVFALARSLNYGRFVGGLAAALFAVHGTRPETAVWITGRFDLVATFFALLALVLFLRGREWLALVAMVLGLLSKESAYSIPLMLAVVMLTAKDRRWRPLIPFIAVTAVLFVYRWILVGGVGGYVGRSGQAEVLQASLLPVLKTFGMRLWAVLFFPIDWAVAPGVLVAVATIVFVAAVVMMVRGPLPLREIGVGIGLIVVTALPTFHRLLIGMDLEKARYLYLPSAGFCLLLAAGAGRLSKKFRWAAAAGLMVFSVAVLEHNLGAWQSASMKAESACRVGAAAVRSPSDRIAVVGLPRILRGVYLFENGFPECVAMLSGADPEHVVVVDGAPEAQGFSRVLVWNSVTDELRPAE
jgi:protein O-mannosyl-transferase